MPDASQENPIRVEVSPSPVKLPTEEKPSQPKKELPVPDESSALEQARKKVTEAVPQQDLPVEDVVVAKAKTKLTDFDDAKKRWKLFKDKRGINDEDKQVSPVRAMAGEVTKIFSKFIDDSRRKSAVMEMMRTGKIKLEGATLKINVMDRNALINDEELTKLWDIPGNRETLTNFAGRELFQEVNATHWLMLTGVSVEQLHAIVYGMGHNPTTKLSGDRGENAGRIAVDNFAEDIPIDESDPRYPEEKKYWEPLFQSKLLPRGMQKWHASRNHSVVYSVKDTESHDVIMLPVHIDPKNAVYVAKEIASGEIFRRKKGEKSALDYHGIPQAQKRYLGTGQYDGGAKQFIHILRKYQPKLFGNLIVEGEDKLDTTGTISGDEKTAMALENVFKSENE